MQLNFFTHMMHNACKYDDNDQSDVDPSSISHFHDEQLREHKIAILNPLREKIGLYLEENTNRQGGETQLTEVDNILQGIDKEETNKDIQEEEEQNEK